MPNQRDELIEIVGRGGVVDDGETLEAYSRDVSFVAPMKPRYVVKPENRDVVEALVKWANQTATPLVPVSSGPPHFRGDTVPGTGGAVIVDLSAMKNIRCVIGKEKYAIVEPGVTFGELQQAVAKEGLRLNMPLLPRSSKSVLGSLLEREPVTMPTFQWSAGDPLGATEVILADGTPFATGSGAGGNMEQIVEDREPMRASVGPSSVDYAKILQGAQGTMGIVVWASVICENLPSIQEPFMVGSSSLEQVLEYAYWLVRRRLAEECLLLNNSNVAAIMARKWPDHYMSLRDTLPPWILFYSVNAYEYFPEESLAYQLDAVKSVAKQAAVEPVKGLDGVGAPELLKLLYQPSGEPYWKLSYKGACQDIFFITSFEKISELAGVMYDSAGRYGYPAADIGVYLQPAIQGGNWHCEFNLFYDPANSKDAARVQRLLIDASEALMAKGAFFSRPYGPWADMVYARDTETTSLLRNVKRIFDPNDILNPGKLCF